MGRGEAGPRRDRAETGPRPARAEARPSRGQAGPRRVAHDQRPRSYLEPVFAKVGVVREPGPGRRSTGMRQVTTGPSGLKPVRFDRNGRKRKHKSITISVVDRTSNYIISAERIDL